MKVFYEKITPTENRSFSCNEGFDYSKVPYHHHHEIEITYIEKGTGQRCIGNHIETFYPGDLVICGSMLPHVWIPSQTCIDNNDQHSFVLQFDPNMFGESFWQSKEIQAFQELLTLSQQGIQCLKVDKALMIKKFTQLLNANDLDSLHCLFDLWNTLLNIEWSKGLSPFSIDSVNKSHIPTIEKVIEHLLHHYHEEIRQPDLAKLSSMSVSHFSRFFKKSTGFSFADYLNRIRIDQACQRIRNSNLSIAQIAFDVGYRNLSQFNLNFKKICQMTPKEYQSKSSQR